MGRRAVAIVATAIWSLRRAVSMVHAGCRRKRKCPRRSRDSGAGGDIHQPGKVLQFRERWDLHRETEESFDQLRWEASTGKFSTPAELVAKIGEVRKSYSEKMSAFRVRG